ncbi:thiosulfate transmembrane transporter [Aureococcus anophagefferens]|nr:thiosulfate transmembrane transporter [Aureococcus anophagefferens]
MPRRRVRQARMSRAALFLAASAAAQAPVNVTVVALALPAYGEATTRVWRALGVEGLHVGCGPALRPDLAAYAASYLGDGSFLAARHRLNGDLFDLPPGAATLNNIFTAYGHGRGYLYDYAEFLGLLDEADLGCAPERAAFRESRRIPDVAAAFDGLSRAHESFYVDVVCPPREDRPS